VECVRKYYQSMLSFPSRTGWALHSWPWSTPWSYQRLFTTLDLHTSLPSPPSFAEHFAWISDCLFLLHPCHLSSFHPLICCPSYLPPRSLFLRPSCLLPCVRPSVCKPCCSTPAFEAIVSFSVSNPPQYDRSRGPSGTVSRTLSPTFSRLPSIFLLQPLQTGANCSSQQGMQ
jgi:hypothetical protein